MHVNSAVGKLVAIEFDDALKQISVGAHIVDDGAWQKCARGVYTGFSIGGQYVKAWKDEHDGEFVRFTAKPAEISVVDNPCVPSAHFTAVKTDGSCEFRKFKEAVSTQQSPFSPLASSSALKIGAKHSKETRSHLHETQKFLDAAGQAHQQAQEHMNALLEEDDGGSMTASFGGGPSDNNTQPGAPPPQPTKTTRAGDPGAVPHGHRLAHISDHPITGSPDHPIRTRSHDKGAQNNMLETKDKEQLEKAHAYSASALSKVAEVEKSVAKLREEMESNNKDVQKSLANLLQLLEKLVDPQAANGKVSRTTVPSITVRKEDDGARADKDKGEKSVHDLVKQALQNPQRASNYLR